MFCRVRELGTTPIPDLAEHNLITQFLSNSTTTKNLFSTIDLVSAPEILGPQFAGKEVEKLSNIITSDTPDPCEVERALSNTQTVPQRGGFGREDGQ